MENDEDDRDDDDCHDDDDWHNDEDGQDDPADDGAMAIILPLQLLLLLLWCLTSPSLLSLL